MAVERCGWARSPAAIAYHDTEWGMPSHDDRALFEQLVLEGAQAGLSWETILNKRAGYRALFADFEIATVAAFTADDVERIVADARIVRHRGKVESAVKNARAVLQVQAEFGSFDAYLWGFVGGAPVVNRPATREDLPATSPLAETISNDLKRRGFTFVGPTIVYAFLQATGVVDDHHVGCFKTAAAPSRGRAKRTG